jgi:hypothetical protein
LKDGSPVPRHRLIAAPHRGCQPYSLARVNPGFRGVYRTDTLFDTFEELLGAADERFEKFIAKGMAVKKVFVEPQEFTAWCSATNVGYNSVSFLAFVIAASAKQ